MKAITRRTALALVSLAVGLVMAFGATSALASPQGDEDPTFNGQGAAFNPFGDENTFLSHFENALTTQDPGDKTVLVAVPIESFDGETTQNGIRVARFTTSGQPADFTPTHQSSVDIGLPSGRYAAQLLDIRVVNGTIIVLYRGGDTGGADNKLHYVRVTSNGGLASGSGETLEPSEGCDGPFVDAARVDVDSNGDPSFVALWDCREQIADISAQSTNTFTRVTRHTPTNTEVSNTRIDALHFGTDIELDPTNSDVYALGTDSADGAGVVRLEDDGAGGFTIDSGYSGAGSTTGDARHVSDDSPVDLAVDYSHRALVWTEPVSIFSTSTPWYIHRLKAGDAADAGAPDTGWGGTGLVTLTDDRLGRPGGSDLPMLLARPDNKVMAIGQGSDGSEVIARMKNNGQIDSPAWAQGGYKQLGFDETSGDQFPYFGNIALQSDNKTLVAFTTGNRSQGIRSTRRFGDPGENDVVGVGRLDRAPSPSNPSKPSSPDQGGVAGTSAGGSVCGRRAISLVRAFSRGRKVELQGLVGAAYFGKKVRIYAGSRRLKTTNATSVGTFKARVRRPRGRKFITTRYVAKAGRSKSPALKLPQSLRSTSIKSKAGKLTVRGKVKRALLGRRRNKVKIQRLVCGHYKTVGSARPTRSGRYKVTFDTPRLGGVSYFRARGVVLNKPHGRRYVVQYARAIRIKLTAQTG